MTDHELTRAYYRSLLRKAGFNAEDAEVQVDLHYPEPEPPARRRLLAKIRGALFTMATKMREIR